MLNIEVVTTTTYTYFENDGRTVESDCSVNDFSFSEFNDIDSEDWIDNNELRKFKESDDEDDE